MKAEGTVEGDQPKIEPTSTPPNERSKQRGLQNISYNYLVEACVDKSKARIVLNMMNEALSDAPDMFEDVYKDSEFDDRLIQQILLDTRATFATRLMEANLRSPEITKKTIIANYGKIIKDDSMRKELWIMISRLQITKKHYPKTYYPDLLNPKNFPSIFEDIIGKDIERTRGTPQEKKTMRNILVAYSIRNSKVGYVQGQNFIARLIIDIIPEEENAFWIYCFLIEECFAVPYFINLKSMMLDALVFRIILKAVEPKLYIHLTSIKDFDLDMITFKWFLCLYADSKLTDDYKNKIWDLLMLGDKLVYLKAGYVLLKELSPRICKCKDISEVYAVFDQMAEILGNNSVSFIQKVNNFYINEYILDIVKVSNQSKLQKAAEMMKSQNFSKTESQQAKQAMRSKEPPCDGKGVLCKTHTEPEGADRDYFSFSCKGILKNKIFDYFSEENSYWEANKKKQGSHFRENDMLVHRKKHTCTRRSMYNNYASYIDGLISTEFKQDTRKDVYASFLEESRIPEGKDAGEFLNPDDDDDVKTVRKGSVSRNHKFFNVTEFIHGTRYK